MLPNPENREQLSDRRTSDEELDALLGTSKTPAEWVAAAEWWLNELGYALPEASPLFKALVAQVKLRRDEVQDPSVDVANVNAAYVIERDDNARLRAALEKIAYPPDFVQSRSVLSTWAREALNGGDR